MSRLAWGTLARYADEGVDVHIAIATDGVAGSIAGGYDTLKKLAAVRRRELDKAIEILGGTLHMLGYRDSVTSGDPANQHPEAFINSDFMEATGRVVALIRQVLGLLSRMMRREATSIPIISIAGRSHIRHSRRRGSQTIRRSDFPYQPQRLYYTAFSNRMVKLFALLMRLRGQDPKTRRS